MAVFATAQFFRKSIYADLGVMCNGLVWKQLRGERWSAPDGVHDVTVGLGVLSDFDRRCRPLVFPGDLELTGLAWVGAMLGSR